MTNNRTLTLLTFFAAIFAAILFLLPPTTYLALKFQYENGAIVSEAEINARVIDEIVNSNPEMWIYEQLRLEELLAKRAHDGTLEVRSIFDLNNNLIAENKDNISPPFITASSQLFDAGRPVGRLEVSRSIRPFILNGAWIALGSLFLGVFSFLITYSLPLRNLRDAFKRLDYEKEKALVTLRSIGDAVITTDSGLIVEYLNPVAENLTGWTLDEAKGRHMDSIFVIFNELTQKPAVNPITECLETESIVEMENHTILVRKTDKAKFHIEDSAAPIRHTDGSIIGAVMVFHDVSERKAADSQLKHIAFHDGLTGLPNRALFKQQLSGAIDAARCADKYVGVLYMDVDNFKIINDSLGHSVGDELLVMVSKRLQRCVRDDDTVSRMGGDEFTAVLNNIKEPENAGVVCTKIIKSLRSPFNIQGHDLHISISIGITIYPRDGGDGDELLKHADVAMYYAKRSGRNNFQYYLPTMNAGALESLNIENFLHNALENNEYLLEYQPKLCLKTNQIGGVEALLRWLSPDLGRVMPDEFIRRLEDSGEIVQVGLWVLKTAIAQAKEWMDAGNPIAVSVNVSPRQFYNDDFVKQITSLLKEADLPGVMLKIEVTENLFMNDDAKIEMTMRELTDLGVQFSLDDFGTGYSSLSYLKRFPISELKIDRSFILDLANNKIANKLVQTIVDLGKALGITVTAEGVETEEQLAALRLMGCDEIQGYLVRKPQGITAFNEWTKLNKR